MKFLFSFLLLFLANLLVSQEQLGLRLENYAGVSSLAINPTGNLSNPLPWDVNLVGAGAYFGNNYFFLKGTSTFDLLANGSGSSFFFAPDLDNTANPNTYVIDFFDDANKRFFTLNSYVAGPSFVMKIGENHSAGIFTNFRTMGSALDVPNEFSFYQYDSRPFFEPFPVGPFQSAFMSWAEIGINYAVKIPTYAGYVGFGINLKHITGFEAGYFENLRPWEQTKLPDDIVAIGNGFARYGLTTSNLSNNGFDATGNGRGFGFDIGFVKVVQEYEDGYRYRLSAALLDIGFVNFTKNAKAYAVENPGTFQLVSQDFERFNGVGELEDMLRFFSQEALGDSLASLVGNEFRLALPTALSLQADYSFTENIFLNATLFQRLPTKALSPKRESILAVVPRFEHRWFSASLPVSLLNWKELRLGFAARLGFLTVGSDKIGSLIRKSNYSGSDIYFALKVNHFDLGLNLFQNMGGKKRKFGNKKNVKCYF